MLKRLHAAMSPAALLIAILALVVSAAGAGYAAATIGTKDIKNNAISGKKIKKNAVTGPKIKAGAVDGSKIVNGAVGGTKIADGSLSGADIADHSLTSADLASPGFTAAALSNGGEGDCVWSPTKMYPYGGTAVPSYRINAVGNVELVGSAKATAGGGGDGACTTAVNLAQYPEEIQDKTMFVLPAGLRPAHTVVGGHYADSSTNMNPVMIAGPGATFFDQPVPHGAVLVGSGKNVSLDGIEFVPAGG